MISSFYVIFLALFVQEQLLLGMKTISSTIVSKILR